MKEERGKTPPHLKKDRELSKLRHLESMVLTLITGAGSISALYIAFEGVSETFPSSLAITVLLSSAFSIPLFIRTVITKKNEIRLENIVILFWINILIWLFYLSYFIFRIILSIKPIFFAIPTIIIFIILITTLETYLRKDMKSRFPIIYEKEIEEELIYIALKKGRKGLKFTYKKITEYSDTVVLFILTFIFLILVFGSYLRKLESVNSICNPLVIGTAFLISSLFTGIVKRLHDKKHN